MTADPFIQSAVFSPQGILATADPGGAIQLWDLDPNYAISQVCGTTMLTPQQWHQYLPQVPYQPPCHG